MKPALIPLLILALGLLSSPLLAQDDAAVVATDIPNTLLVGRTYRASVTVRNTGTSTWTADGLEAFKLGTVEDQDPFFPATRVYLPRGARVLPGGEQRFAFTLTAPAEPGSYVTDWRMVHELVRWFGAVATRTVIVIGQAPPAGSHGEEDQAEVVGFEIPDQMRAGERFRASVRMRNAGQKAWTNDGDFPFKLGAVDDQDPFHADTRVYLPSGVTIPPGGEHRFVFELTAPTKPGRYTTDWRMVHELVRWFGPTAIKGITVLRGPVVDASSLDGKFVLGYQGWFAAEGDRGPWNRWMHWFNGSPAPGTVKVDLWPDLRDFPADELYDTGFTFPDGRPAKLFSSSDRRTVMRHFQWMAEYDLDGVALQRFTTDLGDPRDKRHRDLVAGHVKAAAEQHGRVFFLMYDISGHNPATVYADLKRDWAHMVYDLGLTRSDRYLKHRGKPLLGLWGFGFEDRPGDPGPVRELQRWFQNDAPLALRATLVGGVPEGWRTLDGSSKKDPAWGEVYLGYEVVSPWSVGRYHDEKSADDFRAHYQEHDLVLCRQEGRDYMPVVWPGFSWHNLFNNSTINLIPRRGGRFYWSQLRNGIASQCGMMFGAMFDEVDEGTAIFKAAETRNDVPTQAPFLTLDYDGIPLPSDWYMRLAGAAGRQLRGETPLTATMPLAPPAPDPGSSPEGTGIIGRLKQAVEH